AISFVSDSGVTHALTLGHRAATPMRHAFHAPAYAGRAAPVHLFVGHYTSDINRYRTRLSDAADDLRNVSNCVYENHTIGFRCAPPLPDQRLLDRQRKRMPKHTPIPDRAFRATIALQSRPCD